MNKAWFDYLEHSQKDLVIQAYVLLDGEGEREGDGFHDYSFVVFPMAKAYEGFLKKYFFEVGLITKGAYRSDHFRIGKSLNPDLPLRYRRRDWVVDRLDEVCGPVGKVDVSVSQNQKNEHGASSADIWESVEKVDRQHASDFTRLSAMPRDWEGRKLSEVLWRVWKLCRNQLFHYFPHHKHFITLDEAREYLDLLDRAMEAAVRCPGFVRGRQLENNI